MCILLIAIAQHPRYPLIIAANRDEDHTRPTKPMHYWQDQPEILAGRDSLAGGTWFGVNTRGRVAAVTNHGSPVLLSALGAGSAGPHDTPARSRGELIARFLQNGDTLEEYGEFLRDEHPQFSPFNLVYGTLAQLHSFASTNPRIRPLKKGYHAISNGALDDPWPKMSRGAALLKAQVARRRKPVEISSENLAFMMKDSLADPAARRVSTEPTLTPKTRLSPIFITDPHYGTRATTLLLAADHEMDVYEYNYRPDGRESDRQRYAVRLRMTALA